MNLNDRAASLSSTLPSKPALGMHKRGTGANLPPAALAIGIQDALRPNSARRAVPVSCVGPPHAYIYVGPLQHVVHRIAKPYLAWTPETAPETVLLAVPGTVPRDFSSHFRDI
jgi:hypothetical protein